MLIEHVRLDNQSGFLMLVLLSVAEYVRTGPAIDVRATLEVDLLGILRPFKFVSQTKKGPRKIFHAYIF